MSIDDELLTNIVEIQRKLATMVGVSGREDRIREFIYGAMRRFTDNVKVDALGNVLAEIPGTDPNGLRIMLDAHMDEVGFIIRFIDPKGFLRFSPLGGIDKRLYPGSRVLIQTNLGETISGVIGMPPPHISTAAEREKSPDHFGLFIDIGAESADRVEKMGIEVGSVGVLDSPFEYLPELGILRGRAFDDRTGCNVLLQIAKILSESPKLTNTILFSFSIAEEVGARGTLPATFQLQPDIGIAIENTIAADVPGVPLDKCPTSTGGGPAFSVADHGTMYDWRLYQMLKATAAELGFNSQPKLPTFGGTNAARFHLVGKGIPAACVSVPCRYIHSPYGQLRIEDIVKTIKVLKTFISKTIELKY
ncbi:MAG: M42 family metallopeptidase [Promethearchaeota archaeon]